MEEPLPTPSRSTLENIFLSPGEPRLRAGWRILAHSAAYNLLVICVSIPIVFSALLSGSADPSVLWLSVVVSTLATTSTIFLARRFIDRRSIASIGLKLDRWAVFDLFAGIGITFVMMGLIFGIELAVGWLTIDGFAWQSESGSTVALNMLGVFVLFIFVGWNEELLFRGYRLKNLSEGLTPVWGVLISSAWFGVIHLGNPNARILSAVGILLAGLFLAYPVLRTGQLWLSVGLHIGWNFFEGPVFGFPVSGLDIYPLTRIHVQGPELWTGGAFGPEAGLALLPALLVGAGLIFLYTRHRHAADNLSRL